MYESLLAFVISVTVVFVITALVALLYQLKVHKNSRCFINLKPNITSFNNNKYFGKYSICRKIEEADKEF